MNKAIVLKKSNIKGRIDVNDSKSYLHRLLFLAFIQKELDVVNIRIKDSELSNDIIATIGVLNKIGAEINVNDKIIKISKRKTFNPKNIIELNVWESGSTLRFVLPIIATLGLSVRIYGEGRVLSRPLTDLTELLTNHGYTVEHKEDYLSCYGKLNPSVYHIKGYISSQYITGLLFASALRGEGKIKIKGMLVSKPYIELTFQILEIFGYGVLAGKQLLEIKKVRKLSKNNSEFEVDGDWSSASALLVIGAFSDCIEVGNISSSSVQADSAIIDILKIADANVQKTELGYKISKSKLKSIRYIDINSCPDLAPCLAVLLAFADGQSKISGVRRLQDKESDRLQEISNFLIELGRKFEVSDDELIIFGVDEDIKKSLIYNGSDHRLAMAYTAISQRNLGHTIIVNPKCVDKSFASFYENLKKIGLDVNHEDLK